MNQRQTSAVFPQNTDFKYQVIRKNLECERGQCFLSKQAVDIKRLSGIVYVNRVVSIKAFYRKNFQKIAFIKKLMIV